MSTRSDYGVRCEIGGLQAEAHPGDRFPRLARESRFFPGQPTVENEIEAPDAGDYCFERVRGGRARGGQVVETISQWLDRLGLAQYAPAFEANEITLEIASILSDDDLKELGITKLGHRRLISSAIAALRQGGESAKPTPLERRHLTVLFCDLVGSTALSAAIDPEDMATIIADYERLCSSAVARYGGFVARYVGDGILAYFGYPAAREDSAEGAIRAALAIVQDVATVKALPGVPLRVRIGIATGPVVVGDIGERRANRDAVVGRTPNLAARLQGLAVENEIVIADSTHRLVGFQFRCSALDNASLKGFPEPIKAWRVVSERRYRGRFEARRRSGLTPFVGRRAEIEALVENWRAAEASRRVVLITGEAGIGKSRLIRQFTAIAAQDRHRLITYFGAPHLQNSPLRPMILQVEHEAGIAGTDSTALKQAKLEVLLSSMPELDADAGPILSALLSLQSDPADPQLDLDAAQRKRKTLNILAQWLEIRARREPIICICEDVHWFDPTSRELLGEIVDRLAESHVLMILTFRREFSPAWARKPGIQTMRLERLSPTLGAQIVDSLASDTSLSRATIDLIVSKCDGNPLFLEEMTKTVLEYQTAAPADRVASQMAIPDSLQDSLVARLDRLSVVKEIAQIGAAIGREFRIDILRAVSDVGAAELNTALAKLVDAELIDRRDTPDGPVGVFKHALVQEAIYETLLHAKQRSFHRRIAEVFEEESPETCETQPEVLALHWEKAGVFPSAVRYLIVAGKRAASRSATTEASMHFRQALRICRHLVNGRERDELEVEAALQHGGVLRATKGPHSQETGEAFMLARDICLRTGNDQSLFPALAGLFGYYLVGAKNRQAEETARSLLTVAETRHDRFYRMVGHRAVGMVHLHTGNPQQARAHLERSLGLYDVELDGTAAFAYGTDHAQTAASFLAVTLWVLGYADQATAREAWAIDHGTRLNHRYSLVQTAMFQITRAALARDWVRVQALAEQTNRVALEHGFPLAGAMSRFYLAVCKASRGETGKELLDELATAIKARGPINYHPFCLSLVAEAHAASGDLSGGLDLLAEAEAVVEATEENWIKAELLRLRGEMLLVARPRSRDEAQGHFVEAARVAEHQGARHWHLRAVVSQARLLSASGRGSEMEQAVAALYGRFTEGFACPDLRSARAWLDSMSRIELASTSQCSPPSYRFC